MYIEINLSNPIIPQASNVNEPNPDEIVATKTLIKWPFSKTATDDFGKQCAIAIKALTREYHTMFQTDLERQAQTTTSAMESHDAYEERKKEFLYEINKSGKYHILKERMKKTIVRIVKEHFGKKGSVKGLHKNDQDRFYSELYVFLVQ